MPYRFDSLPSRRIPHTTNKWSLYSKDVIPMWIADMDIPTAPQIIAALRKQVEQGVLGYELLSKHLLETIAARMKKLYGWEVDPESIVYTAGVNNGYNIAARVLCSSERGYLIQTPVYNEFHETHEKTGLPQVVSPLVIRTEGRRIRYEVDYDDFRMQTQRAAMFLLCHPHNPVGHIFTEPELRRMAEICIENNVTIVSDQIHCELLLGDAGFTPLAVLSPEIEERTITLISASKAFNVPGLSCAFAVIPNAELRKRFFETAHGMSFEISSTGLTAAYIAYSGRADAWLRALRRHLTSNRDYLLKYLDENMPGVRVTRPEATYLAWLDCSELNLKPTPQQFFHNQAGVVLSPGEKFGKEAGSFVRLNFGTSRSILAKGLKRMSNALAEK
jgi:cystathionine beta-lyase